MRVKCCEFDGTYNFVINNVQESDIDPVNVIMDQYENTNHKPFTHLKAWLKLKNSPKWQNIV